MIKNAQETIQVYNREDLLKRLRILKNTLSGEKYDQFIALIDGEISPFDKSITNAEAKLFSEFKLYREAVINSLAKRAYEAVRNNPNYEVDYHLSSMGLSFYGNRRTYCFKMNYNSKLSSQFACITLYKAEENNDRIEKHIQYLRDSSNKYINYDYEIRELQKPELTEIDEALLNVANPAFDDIMKSYGLKEKDFKLKDHYVPILEQYKQRKNCVTLTLEKKHIKKLGE